jgi:HSP20 family protein
MPTLIPQKTKQKEEAAPRGGALIPRGEFPFFLSQLRDEFDQLFEQFSRGWPSLWEGEASAWRWGLDVREEDDAVVVRAEAPGFEPGDLDLQVSENRLILRASKKVETKDEQGKRHEYREQECYQSVTLPPGIDKDRVEAKYHNGVLTVTMPKTAESRAKRITVKKA